MPASCAWPPAAPAATENFNAPVDTIANLSKSSLKLVANGSKLRLLLIYGRPLRLQRMSQVAECKVLREADAMQNVKKCKSDIRQCLAGSAQGEPPLQSQRARLQGQGAQLLQQRLDMSRGRLLHSVDMALSLSLSLSFIPKP